MEYLMSWQYIAGFFDGEGSIYFKEKTMGRWKTFTCTCTMTQAEFQGQVIYEIKEFLDAQRIHSRLYRVPQGKNKNTMLTLYIASYGEMQNFLRPLLPFLIVKREKALKALTFCEDKMKKRPSLTLREKDEIVLLNSGGMYVGDIATKMNRHYETIRDFLAKKGIKRNYKIRVASNAGA